MRPLLVAGTLVAAAAAAVADAPRLGWQVEPQHLLRWKIANLPAAKGEKTAAFPVERWTMLAHELNPTGDRWPMLHRWQAPLALVVSLPDRALAEGKSHDFQRRFESFGDLGTVQAFAVLRHAKAATFLDLPCRELALRGHYVSGEDSKDRRYWQLLAGGFDARLFWHPGRGHLLGGEVHSWWRLKRREVPKGKPPEETLERYRFRLECDLVLKTDEARFQELTNQAIQRGMAYLFSWQQKDGSWPGTNGYPMGNTALALLALLASGAQPADPRIAKGFAFALSRPIDRTYSVAVALMALEARHLPPPEKLHAMKLEERRAVLAALPGKLSAAEREWVDKTARWLLGQEAAGVTGPGRRFWSYPSTDALAYDNSNSQYAALGLLAASRLGVKVPPSTWAGVSRHWLAEQDTNGPEVQMRPDHPGSGGSAAPVLAQARGWNYRRGTSRGAGGAYGSMTCAGVGSLAIARHMLREAKLLDPKEDGRIDKALRDGLAWLQKHYSLRTNPPLREDWFYYYLYGLERAGVLSGATWLGDHHWYQEGAGLLVTAWQRADGSWNGSVQETAFALLFLKKATPPLETSGK